MFHLEGMSSHMARELINGNQNWTGLASWCPNWDSCLVIHNGIDAIATRTNTCRSLRFLKIMEQRQLVVGPKMPSIVIPRCEGSADVFSGKMKGWMTTKGTYKQTCPGLFHL